MQGEGAKGNGPAPDVRKGIQTIPDPA